MRCSVSVAAGWMPGRTGMSKGAHSGEMAARMSIGGGDGSRGSKISKPGDGEEMSRLVWNLL